MKLSKNDSFSLLTLNLFMRPPGIKNNEDDYKNQRLNDLIHVLDRFDIVCFQQLFQTGNFRPQQIISEAVKLGYFFWVKPSSPNFFFGPAVDSGLLIISKHQIIQSKFQSYNVGILSDSAADKGYAYCKINFRGRIVHLFNTHFQASYLDPGKDLQKILSVKTRLYQVQILSNRIKHLMNSNSYDSSHLVLLAGDLNINGRQKPYKMNSKIMEPVIEVPSGQQEFEFYQFGEMMKIFKKEGLTFSDLGYNKNQCHPVTFGEDQRTLTDPMDVHSEQRLDYIFQIKTTQSKPTIVPLEKSIQVQKFKLKNLNKPYTQVSDHYGVSIICEIK